MWSPMSLSPRHRRRLQAAVEIHDKAGEDGAQLPEVTMASDAPAASAAHRAVEMRLSVNGIDGRGRNPQGRVEWESCERSHASRIIIARVKRNKCTTFPHDTFMRDGGKIFPIK
ncbi:hypothetical protein AXF42_Ash010070 [Apostasia shenzhenica]|uniref:Uncharacterized protein n=1 Tax=Apostasia shenzhenica TaxID=1088818 RepID=A0A2I0ACS4_9ASPA|nr:hypothetical protein AXF42_Ash010070 [Apostasia shenzhenica]